jgi:hypothetical protein
VCSRGLAAQRGLAEPIGARARDLTGGSADGTPPDSARLNCWVVKVNGPKARKLMGRPTRKCDPAFVCPFSALRADPHRRF